MTQIMSDDEIVRRAQQIVKKREEEKERQEQLREKLKKDKEEHEKKYELLIEIAKNKFCLSLTLSYEIILALELEEKYKTNEPEIVDRLIEGRINLSNDLLHFPKPNSKLQRASFVITNFP